MGTYASKPPLIDSATFAKPPEAPSKRPPRKRSFKSMREKTTEQPEAPSNKRPRARPFKSAREKRRRDRIKTKLADLYDVCQSIAPRSDVSEKRPRKMDILAGAIQLLENVRGELIELRTRNKELISHLR